MKFANQSLISFRFITLCTLITTLISFYSNPVNAGKVSPRQVIRTGQIVTTAIGGFVGGVFKVYGEEAARRTIQSGQPYTMYRTVTGYDGLTYYICQNFQNGRPISPEYWCR